MKLINTRKAVEEYDKQMSVLERELDIASKQKYGVRTVEYCEELIIKMEKLGEAVGIAFWEDTKDINNLDTCRSCIRPGSISPPPGQELSFVRKLLKKENEE